MSLAFIVYLVTTLLPAISTLFCAIAAIGVCIFLYSILVIIHGSIEIDDEEEREVFYRKTKFLTSGIVFSVAIFFSNLIPDKESSYAILAAYGVEEVAKNEQVQEFAGKSFEVIEKAMNDYIGESGGNKE